MTKITRRASFAIGLATAAAGPAVVAANLVGAAAALGPAYPWRFLTWGRRENTVNAAYFPRRAIAVSGQPAPLPRAPDPVGVARAMAAAGAGSAGLDAFLEGTQTTAFLVARDDRVVQEAYANGAGPGTLLTSRSMAKSVLGLLVGVALAEGRLASVDSEMETLLPDVAGLRGSGVSLRHMLQMGGGLLFRGDGAPLGPFTEAALWDGTRIAYFVAGLRRYLATARGGARPGERFVYDDRSAQLVGLALERAFGVTLSQALGERIWAPMGAEHPAAWALNGRADGLEKSEGGLDAAAVDWLKLGQLVLHEGAGIVPSAWVARMTAPIAPLPPGYYEGFREFAQVPGLQYGMFWWVLPDGDCFMHGLYGQVVYVCRRRRMVLVRTGITEGGIAHWPSLLRRVCDAMA